VQLGLYVELLRAIPGSVSYSIAFLWDTLSLLGCLLLSPKQYQSVPSYWATWYAKACSYLGERSL